jgi:4-alpha-glucanotransferase
MINDTTIGWWTSGGHGESTRNAEDIRAEREYARSYLNTDGRRIHWDFIRALQASVADTVLIPLQDVLGLGSEARMNQPATLSGNWRWRYRAEMLTIESARQLKTLTELYERPGEDGPSLLNSSSRCLTATRDSMSHRSAVNPKAT